MWSYVAGMAVNPHLVIFTELFLKDLRDLLPEQLREAKSILIKRTVSLLSPTKVLSDDLPIRCSA